MPRQSKPPRLWLEPERTNSGGKVTHGSTWIILDGGKKHRTGCLAADYRGAAQALEQYPIEKHGRKKISKNRSADEILVAEVLGHYMKVKGEKVAAPHLLAMRIDHLLDFWGEKTLDEIDSLNCAAYLEARHPWEGGARRELEDLRTAISLAQQDKICREEVLVTLPPKPKPRSEFLERDQIARLIWHAYRKREHQKISRGPRKGEIIETKKRPARHLARFILMGIYTGTRSKRLWTASYTKRSGHPWIDVDGGVFYREAPGEAAADNKRAPSIRIPGRMLAHLRRWREAGAEFLCEYHSGKPGDPKKAFARLVKDVLGDEGEKIVRHSLRHTSATWLLMAGNDPHRVAGFLGMRTDTLISVYGHHHPEYQEEIGESFTVGKAGRTKVLKKKGYIPPSRPVDPIANVDLGA